MFCYLPREGGDDITISSPILSWWVYLGSGRGKRNGRQLVGMGLGGGDRSSCSRYVTFIWEYQKVVGRQSLPGPVCISPLRLNAKI